MDVIVSIGLRISYGLAALMLVAGLYLDDPGLVLTALVTAVGLTVLGLLDHRRRIGRYVMDESQVVAIELDLNNLAVMNVRITCKSHKSHNRKVVAFPQVTERGIIYSPAEDIEMCENCITYASISGAKEVRLG